MDVLRPAWGRLDLQTQRNVFSHSIRLSMARHLWLKTWNTLFSTLSLFSEERYTQRFWTNCIKENFLTQTGGHCLLKGDALCPRQNMLNFKWVIGFYGESIFRVSLLNYDATCLQFLYVFSNRVFRSSQYWKTNATKGTERQIYR